jgi:hypothetical protein
MANLDANTPQMRVVKKWAETYTSLDARKLEPILSKHYKHQSFPKSIYPDETKEEHIQRCKGYQVWLTKIEVRIQRRRTAFELTG